MNDIHDIKEPITLVYNYIPILITAIILSILFILFIYLSLKKKSINYIKKDNKRLKLDPKSIALNELEKIKKDKLIELNRYHAFYTKITVILKNFLQQQYNIDTESNTTQEIIEKIRALNLDSNLYNHFEKCLRDYDYAKYSGYKLNEKEMNDSLNLTNGLFKSL